MRESSTEVIYNLIRKDRRVIAITADSRNGIFDRIRREFPLQYVDYGIAESNMVASAAGLASCGMIPFIFAATNFVAMRAFEFIRNDVAIPDMNVKFIGIFSGLARGGWGPTHQGTEDLALLRCLPSLMTITPATPVEAREATKFAYEYKGAVYIRLEASNEVEYFSDRYNFEIGRGNVLHNGNDLTIITIGSIVDLAMKIADKLSAQNISIRVIDMPMLKPIDRELILTAAKETQKIITLEEHSIYGGLGSAVAEILAESSMSIKFTRMGLKECAIGCGNRDEIRELNGISESNIIDTIRKMLD